MSIENLTSTSGNCFVPTLSDDLVREKQALNVVHKMNQFAEHADFHLLRTAFVDVNFSTVLNQFR